MEQDRYCWDLESFIGVSVKLGIRTVPWITLDKVGDGHLSECGKSVRGSIAISPSNLVKASFCISTYSPGIRTLQVSLRRIQELTL